MKTVAFTFLISFLCFGCSLYAEQNVPLGTPDYPVSPEHPTGWRGDGSGSYAAATPPLEWDYRVKGPQGRCWQQADKPKGAGHDEATELPTAAPIIKSWLIAGPFTVKETDVNKQLAEATVGDESALDPAEGDKLGESAWKKGWFVNKDNKNEGFWTGNNQVAFACARLYVEDPGEIALSVQHQHGLRVWVNGTELINEPSEFKYTYDLSCNHYKKVTLNQGWNRVLAKVSHDNERNTGWFGIRLTSVNPSYVGKNIKWIARLPNEAYSMPIIVGNRIFFTSEPNDLICMDKDTGNINWIRSTLAFYAADADAKAGANAVVSAEKDATPEVVDIESRRADVAKLEKMNEDIISDPAKVKAADRIQLAKALQDWIGKSKRYNYHCPGWGGGNCAPTPCSDGKFVYVWHGEAGILGCYDLNGNRQWVSYLHPLGPGDGSHHGVNGSPVIAGDKITILGWGCFLGIDKSTGKLVWRERYNGTAFSSHIVSKLGSDYACAAPTGEVHLASTGKSIGATLGHDGECASPGFDPQQNTIVLFHRAGFAAEQLPSDLSQPTVKVLCKLSADKLSGYTVGSPLIHDGLSYCVNNTGLFYAVETATGNVLYKQQLNLFPTQYYGTKGAGMAASICLGGKHIFVMDNRGGMLVLEPGHEYKQAARNFIQFIHGEEQEYTLSTSIFEGNRIYIRGSANFYCISPN